ncbi:MAG: CYTH domain-containing protein [Oscillospiraceae bacterium]|nr:CYTH domain-containing protein [Oscillospiraceae bacterium]
MIENEFKLMLTEEQYGQLRGAYDFNTITQTNHYYDTNDLQMSEKHITVRVRELDGRFFLQMKLPTGVDFSRVELSRELDELPDEISGELLRSLSGEELPALKRLGALSTTRSIWEFDGGELDLDRSEYFGKVDYEAEIEFTDEQAARAVLAEIKKKLGITASSDVCTGKLRRFLEEYRKQLQR